MFSTPPWWTWANIFPSVHLKFKFKMSCSHTLLPRVEFKIQVEWKLYYRIVTFQEALLQFRANDSIDWVWNSSSRDTNSYRGHQNAFMSPCLQLMSFGASWKNASLKSYTAALDEPPHSEENWLFPRCPEWCREAWISYMWKSDTPTSQVLVPAVQRYWNVYVCNATVNVP